MFNRNIVVKLSLRKQTLKNIISTFIKQFSWSNLLLLFFFLVIYAVVRLSYIENNLNYGLVELKYIKQKTFKKLQTVFFK